MKDNNGRMELLAPGGDVESIKAAILGGADAVYCGLDRFNARNRAHNLRIDQLNGIIRLAHINDCKVFLTLNIIIVENEIAALVTLLNRLVNTRIDGVIVQDYGMFYLLSKYFKNLQIHASTQLTTNNKGQIQFLSKLNAVRVNLSRELSLDEIKELSEIAHKNNQLTEVFVHGSYCLSFSGICYMSSVHGGNSGNRGRCSQPCRDQYVKTTTGNEFPLNLKDNSAYSNLKELFESGVDSIKIEGRIKKFHYVHTVVSAFRKQLYNLYSKNNTQSVNSDLYKVYNRDFTNNFLKEDINKSMFIDNPRDNSAIHRAQTYGAVTDENIEKAKRELYDEKTDIINSVKRKIDKLSIEQALLSITVSGKVGIPLKVAVQTPDTSFTVFSRTTLAKTDKKNSQHFLTHEMLLLRLKTLNETQYFINHLISDDLESDLFIPFKELTRIRKKIFFILNGSREFVDPIDVPSIKRENKKTESSVLSLLISSAKDVYLCDESSADIYFQLPCNFKNEIDKYRDLFTKNSKLIPWFQSVLIGEDYLVAEEFLKSLKTKSIVTNNSGIAYTAYKEGVPWLAGPSLNSVNSFSLECLKRNFNCSGAFISNELKRVQIKSIKKPSDFKLYYSIYHPITLMTSRHCLFHQVTGCDKNRIDATCIERCERTASITNLKDGSFFIEKTKGNYNELYNETNFLNTEIVTEIPNFFFSYLVDLREIQTNTGLKMNKLKLSKLFENHLAGDPNAAEELKQSISPSVNTQYYKGI
jgi:U32 family peptidase